MNTGNLSTATIRDDEPQGPLRATAARLRMAALVFSADRRELWEMSRQRFMRAVILASILFCVVFVAVFVVRPLRNAEVVRVVLPPTRTVLLKDIVPEPPAPAEDLMPEREQVSVRKVADPPVVQAPEQAVIPPPVPPKVIDKVAAQAGRQRAKAATASLTKATASLDKALGDLTSSLGAATSGDYRPSRRARARNVGAGRSDGQLGAVGDGLAGGGASDLGGSAVQGKMVSVGSLAAAAPAAPDRAGAEGAAGSGSKPGVYRTNASLLAVIQKYAAGIQYCYESELKRDERLTGKLVVAMTVTAAGNVQDATVVRNTLGNERLAACALSQIRSWKFPPVQGGLTTFQAPFVFTPPK
jgi:TonB family protein